MGIFKTGFTLIEIILSLALVAILAATSVPLYRALVVRNDLDVTAGTIAQTLRRAEALAFAVDGNTGWGVAIGAGGITLFKGTTFTSRDQNFDERFDVPADVAASGPGEIDFANFLGTPQQTGAIILISNTNESRTITVNAKGTVNY